LETLRHEEYMKRMATNYDPVNRPTHYNNGRMECIDAIQAATEEGYEFHLQGTIIKYIWRYRNKDNPVQDLMKARWYLDRLIEEYSNDN